MPKLTCPSCGARRGAAASCPVCGYVYDERENEHAEDDIRHPEPENSPALKKEMEQKEILFCPQCGKRIEGAPKFCGECGANLEILRRAEIKQGKQPTETPQALSTKPMLAAIGAIVVIAAGIILGMWLFREKPAATAQQNPTEQQAPQPAKPSPTPEQLTAIQNLNKTLAANPSDTAAMIALANVYYDIDDYQNAIPYYRQYIQSNARTPNVLVDYAYCLFRNGQSQDAIAEMKEAIKINPKFQQAYFNLSIVNLSIGNTEDGMEWMKKCIAVDSTTNIAQEAKQLLANHAQLFQQQQ